MFQVDNCFKSTRQKIYTLILKGCAGARPYLFAAVLSAALLCPLFLAFAAGSGVAESEAAWTYLVFLNDGAGSAGREINKLENIKPAGFININALWYNKKDGVKTVYEIVSDDDLNKISSKELLREKINENDNISFEFSDFVIKYYLKHKTPGLIITLYDRETVINHKHDFSSPVKNWNNLKNLRAVFEKIREGTGRCADIVHFDANNFQCLELIYELSDHAVNVIGSEELIPECGTPYDTILNPIVSQKITAVQRFSFLFVSAWHNYFKRMAKTGVKATLSAVKTAELDMVSEKFDALLEALTKALAQREYRDIFTSSVIKKVRRYSGGEFIDAFDLGRIINEEIHEQSVEKSSREFLASLTNATVKNSAIGDFGKIPVTYNSFGMSIYMPLPAPKFDGYGALKICGRTGWKPFLDYFYSFFLAKGYDFGF